MIKKIYEVVNNTRAPAHTRPAVQIGNYCYIIAAVEMLLSCPLFVKFIFFYTDRDMAIVDRVNISPLCKIIQNYVRRVSNVDLRNFYSEIENIVLLEFDIKNRGESEDMNVVFLYFERSILYLALFSQAEYVIEQTIDNRPRTFNAIFMIRTTATKLFNIESYNYSGVYAVAIHARDHYEIFRRVQVNDKHHFVAMNTNELLPCVPNLIIIFLKVK